MSANAEANAPAGDAMSEAERQEVGRLRKEVDAFSLQHEGILDSLRAAEVGAISITFFFFFLWFLIFCYFEIPDYGMYLH